MNWIKKHPDLPDYFFDITEEDYVVHIYEEGSMLILPDLSIPGVDYEFLQDIVISDKAPSGVRKCKLHHLTGYVTKEQFPTHIISNFVHLYHNAEYFQQQLIWIGDYFNQLVKKAFPSYKILHTNHTLRLATSIEESLHFDSYSDPKTDELWGLRLFYNLDTLPRIWHTSYDVFSVMEKYGFKTVGVPNHFNRKIITDRKIFPNGNNTLIDDISDWPRHEIAFPPNCLWMVNSQIVSHEVMYGRKMLAFTYWIDPKSMNDPKKNFHDRMLEYA